MVLATPARSAAAAAETVELGVTRRQRDVTGRLFRVLLVLSVAATVGVLGVLLWDVLTGGWSTLAHRLPDFLTLRLSSKAETSGLSQAIRGTFYIGVFVTVFAFPLGIGAAIYLEEYARPSRFTHFIDVNIRNLAGVPSVVYGILGLTVFVKSLGAITGPGSARGATVVSAGLTLAVLVLPIVIITAAEAIRAVPDSLREASYGVGASKWDTVRQHVLPYAAPGILTGTVLSLARALGEAAPLILVGATTGYLTQGESYGLGALQERFTALPIVIATWAGRPGADYREITAAAIVVLLVIVLLANTLAVVLRSRFERRRG